MLFEDVTLVDEHFKLRRHMYLGVYGACIDYLGDAPPPNAYRYGETYGAGRSLLLTPGFYNAHSHAPMHVLRGYGENLALDDWLQRRIFPFEDRLTADDIFWACKMGIAEMLRFGIVSTTDMYMRGEAMGRAFATSDIKANFSVGTICMADRDFRDLPQYAETLALREQFHNWGDGKLRVEFSLHGEYTSHQRVAATLAEAAAETGSAIHVHVAETAAEVAGCKERHGGLSPVQYLDSLGFFEMPVTAAHCVHIDGADIAILKQKRVSVAHCPKSNLKLASGFCPAARLLAAGVNVALGTDSVASNNNLNMLEELKTFALIHKGISGDATLITPAEALYAATRAGALAQGREDCGLLKEGWRADIAVFDIDRIYMRPAHDLLNNLVYAGCGSDVCLTMVDGGVLYRDGSFPTLDIEELLYHTDETCRRVLDELAAAPQ
ncbi:MAG: amidohydrolase [Clostridia bacterium]|nr:amidohydrolase [Clostridia bacterium]